MIPGLTSQEVLERRARFGYNKIEFARKRTVLQMFFSQFKNFMILILIIAAIISGVLGLYNDEGLLDTFVILGIVLLNAVIGTVQEKKAQSSLEALKKLSAPKCKVYRDGNLQTIPAEELVPGDTVVIETGDFVPADIKLTQTVNLKIQRARLGRIGSVEKSTVPVNGENIPVGDRTTWLFQCIVYLWPGGQV